jgi:hypothetical protein
MLQNFEDLGYCAPEYAGGELIGCDCSEGDYMFCDDCPHKGKDCLAWKE